MMRFRRTGAHPKQHPYIRGPRPEVSRVPQESAFHESTAVYQSPEIQSLHFDPRLSDHEVLHGLKSEADQLLTAFRWKRELEPSFPLIVCLMGGTGTGKSTLFNSLSNRNISDVGMRRPCTVKAVMLVHEDFADRIQASPYLRDQTETTLTVVRHSHGGLAQPILVDTPDFDSVEASNRAICESFFVISDVVIFVTSQEKYADHSGWEMLVRAIRWGKKTICVMNKTTSDTAYRDFQDNVLELDRGIRPVRVEKLDFAVESIPGLRDRSDFAEIFPNGADAGPSRRTRDRELEALLDRTVRTVASLQESAQRHAARIASVNSRIRGMVSTVSREMDSQLDAIVTENVEAQIRERLRTLLRKYDILFVPRMVVRNALRKVFFSVTDMVGIGRDSGNEQDNDRSIRSEDLEATRAAARLEPLQAAVARLNVQIAEFLSSDSGLEDLRAVAGSSVARWDAQRINSLYEDAFPGVEHLLEAEFSTFREGLSRLDEVKLYGSYTVWALLLITAEIVVGGGFTLFDAVLNTVIVPFIPKWLLNVKVVDLLREIGERVDREHRNALRNILEQQADLYITEFSGLAPAAEHIERLGRLRTDLSNQGLSTADR